jgi:hypothetical protein
MISLTLPDVFNFFDSCRNNSVSAKPAASSAPYIAGPFVQYLSTHSLRITLPSHSGPANADVTILDIAGKRQFAGVFPISACEVNVNGIVLPTGVYHARIRTAGSNMCAAFMVAK